MTWRDRLLVLRAALFVTQSAHADAATRERSLNQALHEVQALLDSIGTPDPEGRP
jgi:hypothetical protein